MPNRLLARVAAPLAALAAALPAAATTFVLPADGALADQASLIVEATVLSSSPAAGAPATEHRLQVDRLVKGALPAPELVLRTPGGVAANGYRLQVWGTPELHEGARGLFFLRPRPGGTWGAVHLALGVFHEQREGAQRLAVRDFEQALVLDGAGAEAVDRVRDLDRFSRWLADRAAGIRREADYFVEAESPRRAVGTFTYIGRKAKRWPDFDQGKSVPWRAHQSGQPLLPGGGFDAFQGGIAAWNADAATNIRYQYAGTTSNSAGFTRFDGQNVILFEDPNGEADGTFSCGGGGGVLAIGGPWYEESGNPDVPDTIAGADIVVNDGAGCWFTSVKRAEQVYGHELGHTLGLGHSCGGSAGNCTPLTGQALMRASAHNDERGARLNDDDRAAILSLYPNGGGGGGGGAAPAAPSALAAVAQSSSSVQLSWTDNASNENKFLVEMRTGTATTGAGAGFTQIGSTAANVTTFTATGLTASTPYTFRVRARNGGGLSAYSNDATATTPAAGPTLPAAPAALAAEALSSTSVRLTWQDRSSNELAFRIEADTPGQPGFTTLLETAAGATSIVVGGLQADTPYAFRVRARNAAGVSAPSTVASATTLGGASGACAPSAGALCLRGDRFRIDADWRTSGGQTGAGTAVPLSDQTGLFWFFDPSNIELIVKILDGTSINGFEWTFYGALSDVAYWITVADTLTGERKTYYNPQGNLCGGADVESLPSGAGASSSHSQPPAAIGAAPAASCGAGKLCLLDGRFEVAVEWQTPALGAGTGTPVPLSDASGMFWFFDEANIELVVKALDGRAVNGKHWIFYGALSDVAYTLRVRDTTTGAERTYQNPQGNLCGRADVDAF